MVFCGNGGTATLLPLGAAEEGAADGAGSDMLVVAGVAAGFLVLEAVTVCGLVTLAVWTRFRHEFFCEVVLSELQ